MNYYRERDSRGKLTAFNSSKSYSLTDISHDYNRGMPSEVSYFNFVNPSGSFSIQAFKRYNPGSFSFPASFDEVEEIEIEVITGWPLSEKIECKAEFDELFELFKCLLNAPGRLSNRKKRDLTIVFHPDGKGSRQEFSTKDR